MGLSRRAESLLSLESTHMNGAHYFAYAEIAYDGASIDLAGLLNDAADEHAAA